MPKPYAIRITATKVMIDALRRNDGKITKIDNTKLFLRKIFLPL